MIGIFNNSLPGHEAMSPGDVLDRAKALGMDAVLFGNLPGSFPGLDPQMLATARERATALGMSINAGAGTFNPAQPKRCGALAELGSGDVVAGMERLIRALPALGASTLFFVVGMIEDRDDADVSWADQLEGVIEGVRKLAPALRDTGIRLLIKTHEEISSFEILRIIDAVTSELLGIAHDPVNAACRLEDAVECTRRIAPHVVQIHIDDSYTTFDGEQMRRYLTPLGTGDIDWPALLALVPQATRWVEFHRGQFAMPVFDADWLAHQSDANLDEYRSLLRDSLRRLRAGAATPDQIDVYARLQPTIDWLKAKGAFR